MNEITMIDRAMLGILISFSSFAGAYYGIQLRRPASREDLLNGRDG